jgi:3-oxoacyl-[acyl-carrier-protein] synthase-1
MGAMSSRYNETPTLASRAFDVNRDGFVISGGAGVLVMESLEHALKRKANIVAEITGFGATSDGQDMVSPSGEGAVRCMQQALSSVKGNIDYLNAHGTSTPVGDAKELEAIAQVFKDTNIPMINSTKSLSGHALGAAGVHEAIYSLLMMQSGFISASANIDELDEVGLGMPIVRELVQHDNLQGIMSNSFGFGGTNASLVFEKYQA